nr:odorant binding protein 1 [Pachyrhinus yasumatsui]
MKVILFFCSVTLVTCQFTQFYADNLQNLKDYNTECQEESQATQQDIIGVALGHFPDDNQPLKDHMLCVGIKFGFMDENGEPNRENIIETMSPYVPDETKLEVVMDKCLFEKETAADTAYEAFKCFSENRKTLLAN